jgi:hypothetical protein
MPTKDSRAGAKQMKDSFQSLTEIFIEFIDQIYYPGYSAELDPDQYQFEFNQFSSNYSH